MRLTKACETHRQVGVRFTIEAYEALQDLARTRRTSVAAVLRRGVALALAERGETLPRSLAPHVPAAAVSSDAVVRMLTMAPAGLDSKDLKRLVHCLAARCDFDLAAVRRIVGTLTAYATDYNWRLSIADQLQEAGVDCADGLSAHASIESVPAQVPATTTTEGPRPVGSPPWHEP